VNGFDLADLALTRDGAPVSLSGATLTTSNNVTWTLGNLAGLAGPVGTYVLTLTATGSGIADLIGNPLATGDSDTFTVLADDLVVLKVMVSGSSWSAAFTNYLRSNNMGDGGYAVPVGSGVQLKPLPWSNINQIKVVFSKPVTVDTADLLLSGVSPSTYTVSLFSYDAAAQMATWLFSSSLPADKLLLELNADGTDPIRDASGNALDGEWTNPTSTSTPSSSSFPSGNGTPGGNFCFRFNVLPGDVNQNAVVQSNDGLAVRAALGTSTVSGGLYSPFKDINANAIIQSNDGLSVRNRLGTSLPPGEPTGGMGGAPAPLSEAGGVPAPLSEAGEPAQPIPNPSAMTSPAESPGIPIPTSGLSGSGAFDVLAAAAPVSGTSPIMLGSAQAQADDSLYSLDGKRKNIGLIPIPI
jgi:hypothetical protein